MKVGKERTTTQDVPTNAYAFLSFDHFYVTNESEKRLFFQYSYLNVTNLYKNGDNIGKDGLLQDVTSYAEHDGTNLQFGATVLPQGTHDIHIVTGQLVPKMKGIDGDGFGVYKASAQGLGESINNNIVYKSKIQKSLGGN